MATAPKIHASPRAEGSETSEKTSEKPNDEGKNRGYWGYREVDQESDAELSTCGCGCGE